MSVKGHLSNFLIILEKNATVIQIQGYSSPLKVMFEA